MSYTKGPWRVVRELRDDEEIVCDMLNAAYVIPAAGSKLSPWLNDANLISAAPELLEALEGMLEIYGVYEHHMDREPFASSVEVDCCNLARAAISKARGAR